MSFICKSISRSVAEGAYNKFISDVTSDIEDSPLRSELRAPLNALTDRLMSGTRENEVDREVGLELHRILPEKRIGLACAADPGFWRYLSVFVIPDIVHKRWGDAPDHYWRMNRRIWLKSVWWFVYLCRQKDEQSTRNILEQMKTDEILNLVERPGPKGYRVDLYREIMKQLPDYRKRSSRPDLFRVVMKLNTARILSTEPSLSEGGIAMYVKKLYEPFTD
jgi:hypothetical protein